MKIAKFILLFLLVLISAANLVFFVYWYSVSEVTAVMPSTMGYTVEALALNVTILEMILVLVGFILAALGLFGYTEIKNAAVRSAVEVEARATVNEQMLLWRSQQQYQEPEKPEHGGDYTLGDQPVTGATEAKGD